MNLENYYISRRHRLLVQTTMQSLTNFEPQKLWKHEKLLGLRPDSSSLWKTYLNEGIIEHVKNNDTPDATHYLPYRSGVRKGRDTTKTRIVYSV